MKKLLLIVTVLSLVSCGNPTLSSDQVVVTSVSKAGKSEYYVKTTGNYSNADGVFCFYTKTNYKVGDKIKIVKVDDK